MIPSKVFSFVQCERVLLSKAVVKSKTTSRDCLLVANVQYFPLCANLKQDGISQMRTYSNGGRYCLLRSGCPSFQTRIFLQNLSKCAFRWYRTASTLLNRTETPPATDISSSVLSRRQVAALEEFLYESVGNVVKDPVLGRTINDLKWMSKRIATSHRGEEGAIFIDILLKLPSLLHPSLQELKKTFREIAQANAEEWFNRQNVNVKHVVVNVEALPEKPVSAMSRLLEDPNELLNSLGPGLSSVSHVVAVYSCKVRLITMLLVYSLD
jgi:hypothetical protein